MDAALAMLAVALSDGLAEFCSLDLQKYCARVTCKCAFLRPLHVAGLTLIFYRCLIYEKSN